MDDLCYSMQGSLVTLSHDDLSSSMEGSLATLSQDVS